jgi:hypothetical protein
MNVLPGSEQSVLSGSEPPALPVSGSLAVPEPLAPKSEPPAAPGSASTPEQDAKKGLVLCRRQYNNCVFRRP